MKKLKKKYLAVLEKLGWVEIEKHSPAGEDFLMCVEAENFPDAVREYYLDFDVDEHIEMWIEARRNGTGGVPSTRELVKDAEDIEKMLEELSDTLAEA